MTQYHSPREVAHALQEAALIKLGLLFYNTHSPDTTPVWLLPDPYIRPAHHRAKFGVWPWQQQADKVFVQWCVEKGVEGSAAMHFSKSEILTPDWAWQRFLEESQAKVFDDQLQAAERQSQHPLMVQISLNTAKPGQGRDYQGVKFQEVVWQVQGGKLVHPEQTGDAVFNEQLADAGTLRELALILPQTTDMDWCWIDFGVGVVLPLREETDSPDELWKHVLLPWMKWL